MLNIVIDNNSQGDNICSHIAINITIITITHMQTCMHAQTHTPSGCYHNYEPNPLHHGSGGLNCLLLDPLLDQSRQEVSSGEEDIHPLTLNKALLPI